MCRAGFNEKEGRDTALGGEIKRRDGEGKVRQRDAPFVAAQRMGYFITCSCTAHTKSHRELVET